MRFLSVLSLLSLALIATENPPAHAGPSNHCAKLLTGRLNAETSAFIGYLGELWKQQLIDETQLFRLLESIHKQGRLTNPISEEDITNNSALHTHRNGINDHLHGARKIDLEEVRKWARGILESSAAVRIQRSETRLETQTLYRRLTFNRVEAGEFLMGDPISKLNVVLSNSFELMATPVTQWQWSLIMGANPSKFAKGAEAIVATINGSAIKMQPDHPVEQVRWDDVQFFIGKLNELSLSDDPLLYQLIEGHKKGDQYSLPTEAQLQFVIKNRGKASGTYNIGENEADLQKVAWYFNNSEHTTHPVATRDPLMVDGQAFYDLHGNVSEWVQDRFNSLPYFQTLVDPTGPTTGHYYNVVVGGGWDCNASNLTSNYRRGEKPTYRSAQVGFRLVRIRGT